VSANHSIGTLEGQALLLAATLNSRYEDSQTANSLLNLNATYYWRQTEKWLFYTQLIGTLGKNLDDDTIVELGGDNGLRGYPLRYQSGESSLVVSLEQRYFTDWYPFRLVRVGAAVFADVGRVQGPNALGTGNLGWLTDVGVGLRFAPTRLGTTKVFPLRRRSLAAKKSGLFARVGEFRRVLCFAQYVALAGLVGAIQLRRVLVGTQDLRRTNAASAALQPASRNRAGSANPGGVCEHCRP
jgi:hypothetical protein